MTPTRFAGVLALLIFAAFPSVVLGRTTFVLRDFGLFSYPVAYFQRECFWHGELPLWNPYNGCGMPFLAQWNTLALYPPALGYLLLPLTWALPCFCLAHVFWGGLGMYCLARTWTRHCLAAGVAGILFAFNGLTLNFLMWPCHSATLSWAPWVLWLGQRAWRLGGRQVLWAVGAGALQMLAGGPETILFTWLILTLVALSDGLGGAVAWTALARRFLVVVALVTLLCAAQLLPFLELASHSQRDSGYPASFWPMPLWGWANLLVPLFRAQSDGQGGFYQPDQFWTSSYYVGLATLWLAGIGLKRGAARPLRTLALFTLICLVLALGDNGWLYHALRTVFPPVTFARYPVKFVLPLILLAPLMAAFGVRALAPGADAGNGPAAGGPTETSTTPTLGQRVRAVLHALGTFEWVLALLFVGVCVGLVALDWWHPLSPDAGRATLWNAVGRLAFLALTLLLVRGVQAARARSRMGLGLLLLLVCWLDLFTHVPNQNPTVRPDVFTPGWAAAQLQLHPAPKLGTSRVMISPAAQAAFKYHRLPEPDVQYQLARLGSFADCNLLDSVPQFGGFFSLMPAEMNNVTVLPYLKAEREFPTLLDFCGVAYITAPDKLVEWQFRPLAMPWVTAGQEPIFQDNNGAFLAFFKTNLDFRSFVLLPTDAEPLLRAQRCPDAHILSTEFQNQQVVIRAESPKPALVVIAQSWYPAWKAWVDGAPAKVWRANYAFQAVEIPAGSHQVVLRYRDQAFLLGLALSGLGLLGCGALWLRSRPPA